MRAGELSKMSLEKFVLVKIAESGAPIPADDQERIVKGYKIDRGNLGYMEARRNLKALLESRKPK